MPKGKGFFVAIVLDTFMLSRNEIISKHRLKTLAVDIPDWEGTVNMKQLSARQVLEIQKVESDRAAFVQAVALASIVDDKGKPLFTDDDKEFLAEQPVSVYTAIVQGFLQVNGLTDEATDELKKT